MLWVGSLKDIISRTVNVQLYHIDVCFCDDRKHSNRSILTCRTYAFIIPSDYVTNNLKQLAVKKRLDE